MCAVSFTFTNRRHHCRVCHLAVCNSCSKSRVKVSALFFLSLPFHNPLLPSPNSFSQTFFFSLLSPSLKLFSCTGRRQEEARVFGLFPRHVEPGPRASGHRHRRQLSKLTHQHPFLLSALLSTTFATSLSLIALFLH